LRATAGGLNGCLGQAGKSHRQAGGYQEITSRRLHVSYESFFYFDAKKRFHTIAKLNKRVAIFSKLAMRAQEELICFHFSIDHNETIRYSIVMLTRWSR
jgi:hypothetical protein